MNRILLVVGLLLSCFAGFSANAPKNKNENQFEPCRTPEGLFASARDTIASLNWQSINTTAGYSLQWKLQGNAEWKTVELTQNTYILRGLKPCSAYEFRVKTICGLVGMSEYSESKKFKTIGCAAPCTTPHEVASETGDNKASFKWSSTGARAYEIQIKEATDNGDWRTEIVSGNAFTALNLKACTKYFFHVRSICSDATTATSLMYSEWSSSITVATTGCSAPCLAPRKIYYTATANSAVIKWDSTRGVKYELQVMGPNDNNVWRTISGIDRPFHELTNLANCTYYQARVRVLCSPTSASPWSYIIRFKTVGCAAPCIKPSALKVVVADTIAVFTWVNGGANKYVLQYKGETDANWASVNVTGNVYILKGLMRCKKYIARLQSVCSSTASSDFTNEIKFETVGCAPECVTPRALTAKIVDTVHAILSWTNVNARAYIIEFKNADSEGWRKDTVFTNTFTVKNLMRCTKYAFRVRAICGSRETAPSETFVFATEGCQPVCARPYELKSDIALDSVAILYWTGTTGNYEIQYRRADWGENDWKSVKVASPAHKLILEKCKGYYWRVRKLCDNNIVSDWSELGKFETKGCVTLNICIAPNSLRTEILQDTFVAMFWTGLAGKYEIEYQAANADSTHRLSVKVEGTAYRLPLKPCTGYYWRVRKICDNGVSDWSELAKFETKGCIAPNTCIAPKDLKFELFQDSTTVALYWNGANALKFEVQYRLTTISTAEWQSEFVANPAHKLQLRPCQVYEWRVRGICENGSTDWVYGNKIITRACQPALCVIPTYLKSEIVQDTITVLVWTGLAGKYEIQYLESGADSSHRVSVNVEGTAHKLILKRCTAYYWRVRKICDNGFSDWSEIAKFETKGCITPNICVIPKDLKSEIGQDTIVYLMWTGLAGAYEIQYQTPGTTDWRSVKVQSIEHKLILPRCTGYYWRVRRICDNGFSEWSELAKFETKGCVTPTICLLPKDLKSEIVQDTIAVLAWTGLAGKYEIEYQAANEDSTHRVSVKVEGTAHKLILKRCTGYYWHVRRICDNGVSDWSELAKFETKGCPIAPCEMPLRLTSEIANDTVAVLIWADENMKYDLQYRVKGSGDAGWINVTLTTAAYKLTGLKRCMTYEWKVRKYCTTGASVWSTIQFFTTKGCPITTDCVAPLDLKVKTEGTLAYVLWNDTFERDSVFVQYRLSTEANWNTTVLVGTTPNGVILRGLETCKIYTVRARRKCASGLFSDWKEVEFKLAVNCLVEDTDVTNSLLRKVISDVTVYPNPGSAYAQVEYTLTETTDVKVQLVNVQGQVVKQLDNSIQDAGNYMQVLDNLGDIQQGLYFIIIRTDGKVSLSQKWMKQ